MYLSLFCMAKLINESQKAEKKQKFCIRFLGVFFSLIVYSMLLEGKEIWILHCLQIGKWLSLYIEQVKLKWPNTFEGKPKFWIIPGT